MSQAKRKGGNIHDETVIFALCGAREDDIAICVLTGGEVECPEEDGGFDKDAVVRNVTPNTDSTCVKGERNKSNE